MLGLIFLKYISDAFEERHTALLLRPSRSRRASSRARRVDVAEDRDEYTRRERLLGAARGPLGATSRPTPSSPTIGKLIDDAMVAIERDNPSLKGVLPKDYARPALDKQRLGELIDLIGTIGLGDAESRSKDILGRVYEYFLGQFASAEGKGGGEFYTPHCVVQLLVEMLEPYKGRVYDPCCGSGGMFVQSEKFVGARRPDRRHRHLRPGVEPHHLAAGQDEPGHPRHRGQPRAAQRRHLPRRPAQGPEGRLRPRQPAVQHQRLGRRAAARRRALEVRRAAGGQRQLRLGAALHPPPGAARAWPASCWPTAR